MATCPTCGGSIEVGTDAASLLRLLMADPRRQVYRAANGTGWYVTRGHERFSAEAVQQLVREGRIRSVYSSIPDEAYHVGKTLDCDATMASRKGKPRKEWKLIYLALGE